MAGLTQQNAFAELIERVQAGDEDAAHQLYNEYGLYIVRAVRRKLHQSMRSKFDSLDFAQDVWASFFTDAAQRYDLDSPGQLIALLTAMARNKVAEAARDRLVRRGRNLNRERSLADGAADRLAARQDTPSQILMGEEAWGKLLARQRPVYKRILILARAGRSAEQIARHMRISSKTVQRVIRQALS